MRCMLALVVSALDEIRRLRDELASIGLSQPEERSFRERLTTLEGEAADLFRTFVRGQRGH